MEFDRNGIMKTDEAMMQPLVHIKYSFG